MRAIIAIGISGSGKTTEFQKPEYENFVKVERDNVRKFIIKSNGAWSDDTNFWSIWKFTKENEQKVTDTCNILIESAATNNRDLIIGDTNLNKKYRDILIKKLEALEYEVEFKVFHIDVMEAIKRDERRRDSVGHQVIYKQYEKFIEEFGPKKYVADTSLPKAILCDIDGTLSHMNGKRGPFDWDKVYLDDVDQSVKFILNCIAESTIRDTRIIIFSGRDSCCREMTEKWLKDNNVTYDELYMREEDDVSKDSIVKSKLFWEHVAYNFNVQFVIDDRPQVVRFWHSIGVKTFVVGTPWIEF